MHKFKVLVANDTIAQIAHDLLKAECEVIVCKAERSSILAHIAGVDALFWSSLLKLDKEILDRAGPQLQVVVTMSAGYDHIDIEEIKRRGIKFGNFPSVLNDALADLGVLLALAASRRITEGLLAVGKSCFCPTDGNRPLGVDISGSTVGIVGLGGIGQNIVQRLKSFKVARFLYTGHTEKPEGKAIGAEFVPMEILLRESDFVIACIPLTKETEKMFNAEVFSKMKKTAVFVNISRGDVVNQPDLINALKDNMIFAAGLDVTTPEPLPPNHELMTLPNCVITPHIGSATVKTRRYMAEMTAKNILHALKGEPMITPVL
ncbi:hypothetical protein WA026_001566 [Henosepilachna vigintioctopunctata]|uniref:Glyoxylate reductase/hydroxypyruvate reductase n=1 Tax=Henosepilachna vigintioctopunctata TaxID=420089 RepID=A0AAW1UIF7_9CUCU